MIKKCNTKQYVLKGVKQVNYNAWYLDHVTTDIWNRKIYAQTVYRKEFKTAFRIRLDP